MTKSKMLERSQKTTVCICVQQNLLIRNFPRISEPRYSVSTLPERAIPR